MKKLLVLLVTFLLIPGFVVQALAQEWSHSDWADLRPLSITYDKLELFIWNSSVQTFVCPVFEDPHAPGGAPMAWEGELVNPNYVEATGTATQAVGWTDYFSGPQSETFTLSLLAYSGGTFVFGGDCNWNGSSYSCATYWTNPADPRTTRPEYDRTEAPITTEVTVVPSYGITNCSTPTSYVFQFDGNCTTQEVRGIDVDFTIDNGVVTIADITIPGGDVTEGTFLSSFGSTAFYVLDNGSGSYTVSTAILGGSTGATGSGELFAVEFTPVAEGTSPITITDVQVRDVVNTPMLVASTDGTVQIDCTPPTMDAIVEAEGECYNAAPTFATFTFRDDVNLDLAEYQIDSDGWNTIFSGYNGTVWSPAVPPWTLPGFAGLSEGSHTVYFRVKDDAGNWNGEGTPQPATYSWQFTKDTVAPSPPTDFSAVTGHDKVHLTWTNPTGDASFVGIEIRVVGWGNYPQYGSPISGTPAPSYPADETEGALVAQTALEAYEDDPRVPRDIYYYAAFAYDCAGNYSAGTPTSQDRAASYWLGDISPALVGNGDIQIQDLALFSLTFGIGEGPSPWNAEGDIGPTDDYSRFGVPLPDDFVDFEDLMIFAMNYGNVSPLGTSGRELLATAGKPLRELVTFKLVPVSGEGDLVTYAVVMENDAKVLKGFSLDIGYGLGNELVEVKAARSLSGRGSEHFFGPIERDPGKVEICVAALGVDVPFEHMGEVARVVIRQAAGNPTPVRVERADLRDLSNRKDEIEITTPGQSYAPKVSALMQNHPNPFNPTTRITFDVANAGHVRVEIYDVSGRSVRTLVNEHRGAGRYEVEWDGRNASGTPVHTGMYFYRMTAEGYKSPARKMLLLK